MLFRYLAITFNGHRIYYDVRYAREVEGYGGLVVNGPMQATLMSHMAAKIHSRTQTRFGYRGRSPIFDDAPFMLHSTKDDNGLSLWTARERGPVAMQAKAGWS